jgi:hypothetical protein
MNGITERKHINVEKHGENEPTGLQIDVLQAIPGLIRHNKSLWTACTAQES